MAFRIGELVQWHYRSATGYGKVSKILVQGDTDAKTQYQLKVFFRHKGQDGNLTPEYITRWGDGLTSQPKAKELARAGYEKTKGTSREGKLDLS